MVQNTNLREQQRMLRAGRQTAPLGVQIEARRLGVNPQDLLARREFDAKLREASNSSIVKSFDSKLSQEKQTLNQLKSEVQNAIIERDKKRAEVEKLTATKGLTKVPFAQDLLDQANALNRKANRLSALIPQVEQNVRILEQSREGVINLVFIGRTDEAKNYVSSIKPTSSTPLLKFGNDVKNTFLKQFRKERKREESFREFQDVLGFSPSSRGVSEAEFLQLSRPTRQRIYGFADIPVEKSRMNKVQKDLGGMNMTPYNPSQVDKNLAKIFGLGNNKKNSNMSSYEKNLLKAFSL